MGDGKCKMRSPSHLIGEKTVFHKLKVAGTKFRNKSEKKLLQKEKVAKDTRFQSQLLIPTTFLSYDFSSFKVFKTNKPTFK